MRATNVCYSGSNDHRDLDASGPMSTHIERFEPGEKRSEQRQRVAVHSVHGVRDTESRELGHETRRLNTGKKREHG